LAKRTFALLAEAVIEAEGCAAGLSNGTDSRRVHRGGVEGGGGVDALAVELLVIRRKHQTLHAGKENEASLGHEGDIEGRLVKEFCAVGGGVVFQGVREAIAGHFRGEAKTQAKA